MEGNTDLTFR